MLGYNGVYHVKILVRDNPVKVLVQPVVIIVIAITIIASSPLNVPPSTYQTGVHLSKCLSLNNSLLFLCSHLLVYMIPTSI